MTQTHPSAFDGVADAVRGAHHDDPVLPGSGGPAGNAQLTAWLGLTLLALVLAQLVTLLDVHRLIGWHLAIGLVLIPPVLVKVATTGWRMVRYYLHSSAYQRAGTPRLLLRMLAPLLVLSTLAVLASGIALIFVGPDADARPLDMLGLPVSPLAVHQASFLVWGLAIGLHVVARLRVALRLARSSGVPGRGHRILVMAAVGTAALLVAAVGVALATSWTTGR